MKVRRIVSIILNLGVVIMVALSVAFMVTGYKFMGESNSLTASNINAFKFFTVDSNVLMAVVALIYIVFEALLLGGKLQKIPTWLHILKLVGTAGVTLTLMTVVLFLAPLVAAGGHPLGYWALFYNSNLFLHLLAPVFAIAAFVFCETTDSIAWRYSWLGIVPMGIYSIYYAANALSHAVDGKVSPVYDWYYFVQGGVWQIAIVLPLMLGMSYLFSWLLWLGNRGMHKVYLPKAPTE